MSSSVRKLAWATPTRLLVLGFFAVILLGTALLMFPWSTFAHVAPAPIDALFTATSAVCVTGLIVVNTASYWSFWGKLIILCLLQIGGLGIMTVATAHALVTGRRIGLRERLIIQEQTGQWSLSGLIVLMRRIILTTFFFEVAGAIVLSIAFGITRGLPPVQAAFYGIFHSVSAFCNAGFDILGNSLVDYTENIVVTSVVSLLIISGGLGFYVLVDLWVNKGKWDKLSLHSKLTLRVTVILLLLGTLLIFFLEGNNPYTLGKLSFKGKVLASWFQSVTPRTAGFNTIATDKLRIPSAFLVILFMFIGASPGGTGGGVKTTTFYIVSKFAISVVKGEEDIIFGKRRLPQRLVSKALGIVLISLGLIITSTIILAITEDAPFIDIFFEVMSAFGTVGLSRGITPFLSTKGKLVLIVTMFAGRVGPLSLAIALSRRSRGTAIRYPEEKVSVG